MGNKQISGAVSRRYHIQTVEKMQAEIDAFRARAKKAEAAEAEAVSIMRDLAEHWHHDIGCFSPPWMHEMNVRIQSFIGNED